ncbi:MAG TPA: RNA 2',3'-cyclic phosphodiesterase [Terriglobia bacterium]|jgi:2'-5' RNA ligase
MRLFIAIDLPAEVRSNVADVQRALRPLAESAKWVAPESIHITLKFLGEVPEKQLDDINTAMNGLSWKPFTISVRGVGFFPGNRSPRVFWAGMEAPTMQGLAEELDSRMERLGFEREKRAFRPHITLARARDTRIDSSLVTGAAQYEEHDFGSFTADRLFVIKSTLKSTGSVYEKLKEYLL